MYVSYINTLSATRLPAVLPRCITTEPNKYQKLKTLDKFFKNQIA